MHAPVAPQASEGAGAPRTATSTVPDTQLPVRLVPVHANSSTETVSAAEKPFASKVMAERNPVDAVFGEWVLRM